jgi:acetyltransferase-like isoleucine patch superfamily enzyme
MTRLIERFPYMLRKFFLIKHLNKSKVDFEVLPTFLGLWPDFNNKGGTLTIAKNCTFSSYRLRHRLSVWNKATLEIEEGCFFNDGLNICATTSIKIGSNAKFGNNVFLYDTDFHPICPSNAVKKSPIIIGKNVWIGSNAMVLAGSNIGDHSVIAAGAIISGTIPPKSLVGGVPGKVIKSLEIPDDWLRP